MKPKPLSKHYDRIINRWGMSITRRPRVKQDLGDGTFQYIWEDQNEAIIGQVTQLTGFKESLTRPGFYIEADFLLTFKAGTEIEVGDHIIIDRIEAEVIEKVERRTGEHVDFIECLATKKV